MNFQFDTLAEFIAMNGHGPYVWAAYAITFAALIYLLASPVLQKRSFIKQQKKIQKLAQQNPEGRGTD